MAVKLGAAQQQKVFNAALFAMAQKVPSITNMLTGAAPKGQSDINKKQTEKGAPIVRVTDLEKSKGNEVTVDIIHDINKAPTMGDDKIAGRGDTMTFAEDTVKIDQTRHMLDSGGKMQQQSTGIALPPAAVQLLRGYHARLEEERNLYHLAGARGSRYTKGMILPTAQDPNFKRYMINDVLPPTHSRHVFGGDATSLDSMDSTDLFSLSIVDRLWLTIQEMDNPLQYIHFQDDQAANDDPMYVMLVSPRQWNDFYTSSTQKDWNAMASAVMKRAASFSHRLFKGDVVMYRGILIRPISRFVEFKQGELVSVSNNDAGASVAQVQASVKTHRALLLGAQALAQAWGNVGKPGESKGHFGTHTEKVDHGNAQEHSISWMNGAKKLRFADRDGFVHDHGVFAADTAVSGG